jgi:hypothetical protein
MTRKMINAPVGALPKVKRFASGTSYIEYVDMYLSRVYVDSPLDEIIQNLTDIRDAYSKEYKNLYIDSKKDCGCYHSDCSCSPSYYVNGQRLENDVEYEFRMTEEARRKAEQEQYDRKIYEALKAKFEQ